jgi:hypothetical protein
MATNGQFYWPSVGISVAAFGQFFMAANSPTAVRVLTGEYSPCIHGPVLPCALSLGFDISDYARQGSRMAQATSQFCAGFVQVS